MTVNILTDEQRQELVRLAQAARNEAYAPYSNYWVGAAILTPSGRYFSGCNVENAAYPSCICAERVSIVKAVSEGERVFVAIAVVTSNGGTPCGSCRQVMAEFGPHAIVLIANAEGQILQEVLVSDLLPGAFGPADLLKNQ